MSERHPCMRCGSATWALICNACINPDEQLSVADLPANWEWIASETATPAFSDAALVEFE